MRRGTDVPHSAVRFPEMTVHDVYFRLSQTVAMQDVVHENSCTQASDAGNVANTDPVLYTSAQWEGRIASLTYKTFTLKYKI